MQQQLNKDLFLFLNSFSKVFKNKMMDECRICTATYNNWVRGTTKIPHLTQERMNEVMHSCVKDFIDNAIMVDPIKKKLITSK